MRIKSFVIGICVLVSISIVALAVWDVNKRHNEQLSRIEKERKYRLQFDSTLANANAYLLEMKFNRKLFQLSNDFNYLSQFKAYAKQADSCVLLMDSIRNIFYNN